MKNVSVINYSQAKDIYKVIKDVFLIYKNMHRCLEILIYSDRVIWMLHTIINIQVIETQAKG